ncbi:saccharopine dehydrogenase NADP-binding domain-containing protein [Bacillus sp. FJAT-52991]|uniref:Saccharopine dehydrogenase NADP-binding domain-containing protein n=1 Tax=Bacillus kandeliae TaxID=3129297 RepID=A0ABZ2N1N9_9BACI
MKQIMVVGGSGVLGQLICHELLRIFDHTIHLVVSDYKTNRGQKTAQSFGKNATFRFLDVNHPDSIEQAIHHIDLVIVALKQPKPTIQKQCIKNKVFCIDVTTFKDFVDMTKELDQEARENNVGLIVMSGFFPGLSGLLVKKAIANFNEVSEVNVGLLQNTNAKVGLSGTLDMLKIINQEVHMLNGEKIPGFSKTRHMTFSHPLDQRKVRLIDHAEKNYLAEILPIEKINFWTAWNKNSFNSLIALLKRLHVIDRILQWNNQKFLSTFIKHNPKQTEEAAISIEVKGVLENKECSKTIALTAFSDYHTTAIFTSALAKIATEKEITGVVFPVEITDLEEILSQMDCPKITLNEF